MDRAINIQVNEYQTQITNELLAGLPKEIIDELIETINSIPFIQRLISPDRKKAKDLPRDDKGRIIVDICNPHILEDMDYFREAAIHFQKHGCYTKLKPDGNPRSEFGKWLKREIRRCWYGMLRPTDGEWITGNMYFYLNYFPIIQTKKVGKKKGIRIVDMPEMWEGVYWRFHYMDQARHGGIYDIRGGMNGCEIARRGASKAHPYSQQVLTPSGPKLWGDIKIGDLLYGDDGNPTKVTDIPYDDECDVYKVTLKDGREVYASDEHLWKVWKHSGSKQKEFVLSTKQLLESYKRVRKKSDRNPTGFEYIYRIPTNKAIDFEYKDVEIDPYTFGLLLGDGCFKHQCCYYTSDKKDMETYRNYIPYEIIDWNIYCGYRINIANWNNILDSYKLNNLKSSDKFIPNVYKYNSKEVRLNLLKGLFDSDGFVDKSKPVITLTSKQMIDDIEFICRSLGFNCSVTEAPAGYKKNGVYIPCKTAYTLRVFTDVCLFNLPRKIDKMKPLTSEYSKSRMLRTSIVNIEFSHREKSKCVTVDNESHCYLIGDFVVTHNSYSIGSVLTKCFILGVSQDESKKVRALMSAYQKEFLIKDGTLNKFEDGINHCAKTTQFPSQRIRSTLTGMEWIAGFIENNGQVDVPKGSENQVLGISIKDDPDKIRGKRSAYVFHEEFGKYPSFLDTWQIGTPNVSEGEVSFGMQYAIGTGGSEGSDFTGALEINRLSPYIVIYR